MPVPAVHAENATIFSDWRRVAVRRLLPGDGNAEFHLHQCIHVACKFANGKQSIFPLYNLCFGHFLRAAPSHNLAQRVVVVAPVSEHIHFADGSSIFNNLGIATIPCHTRHVLVVAVLWNTSDCNDTVCDVDAITQQIRTDRHKRGKFPARKKKIKL